MKRRLHRVRTLQVLGLLMVLAAVSENAAAQSTPPADPVSTQAISVPKGEGSIEGMGESFSAQPSTGIATFRVPVQIPKARGAAQPSLALEYSSASGAGIVGIGWNVSVPFIARQTDHGNPKYNDPAGGAFSPDQDRFVFNGGQDLVPLGIVQGGACAAAPGEAFPAWAEGWQYFRPRVEGTFLRFLWSPDRRTWRAFDKTGASMELGVPLDGSGSTNALEVNPEDTSKIFRWNIARAYDNEGPAAPLSQAAPAPVNAVVYKYTQADGITYLSDTYDTPPAANPSGPLSSYAHHAHLVYEARTDPTASYRRGWQTQMTQRLTRVDVSSQTSSGIGTRELVRRYVLAYTPNQRTSLLASVTREGRCATAIQERANGELPYEQACPAPAPMRFAYTQGGRPGTSATPFLDLGYFDSTVVPMAGAPTFGIDDTKTDFLDVNADGLPDILRTFNGSGGYSAWFNGAGGAASSFGAATAMSVPSPGASEFQLDRNTTAPLDIDGNAVVDLLFVPNATTGYIASPAQVSGAWQWLVRPMVTPSDGNNLLNMNQRANIRVMDVNGDGLIDIVRSTTEMQTFFNLGRYPGGDGHFGIATRLSSTSADLVKAPARTCLPGDNVQVQLSATDIFTADMNGDGLVDLVRMRPERLIDYWPGHGDGRWGVVPPPGCPGTTRPPGARGEIRMANAPAFTVGGSSHQRLVDVNGDGLADFVNVQGTRVFVHFNLSGTGFAASALEIGSTPEANADIVDVVDIDGSGTPDIVWGRGGNYRYLDILGGARPNLLSRVENGLGQTTDIAYESSTAMMLEAERSGKPWASKMPIPTHAITKVVTSDNLPAVGRPANTRETSYTYREPAWDSRQREFRGFREVTTRVSGDDSSPSATTWSSFSTGDCADETSGGVDDCSLSERWRDNPREALKGLTVASEGYDDNGVYLSTNHTTYTLRHLYTGLDGRAVRHAFPSRTDAWLYDTHAFASSASSLELPDAVLEGGAAGRAPTSALTLRASTGRAHVQTASIVDRFGNVTAETSFGCVDGCGEVDEAISTRTEFAIARGDTSGWLHRPVRAWTEGSQTPRRKEQTLDHDDRGHPTVTRAVLSGSLPLARRHEDPSARVAPSPATASVDGEMVVSTQQYDAFGNVTFQTAPNHRCRRVTFETDYAQLPIAETVYVGAVSGACGATALTAFAAYDRGLAAPVNVIDLHGELSTVTYDGLGRMVAMRKPSATQLGAASAADSIRIEYFLPSDPVSTPYSLLHTQTQDGPSDGDANYRDVWSYVDGRGQIVATLSEADPSAGDGGQWIASGQTERDAKGAVRRAYEPWFWNDDPKAFPLGTAPPSASSQKVYDAFGRIVRTYGLDGAQSLRKDHHALSTDVWDAEDLGAGRHAGTYASERKDGHGRGKSSIERVRAGGGVETREVQTSYLATGEVAAIRRSRGADTVVRTMQYDSLGRMVLNVEPNSTKPAESGTLQAWRYAYDDSGNVVGTSDARGCGENFFFDAGGRIVAEDFSPCLRTHTDYSAPDLASGNGTETYYRYDSAEPGAPATIDDCTIDPGLLMGRLASVSDRASRTLTSFDPRGRTACRARQIAKPGAPDDVLSHRYAPDWFTQTAAYDAADRPLRASTGARVAEQLGAEGTSFVTTAYSGRGTMKSVGGSYGTIVSRVEREADGLVARVIYGDSAETTRALAYDVRRRVRSTQTYRGPSPLWSRDPAAYTPAPAPSGAPTSFQLLLEDVDYAYDLVDNPTRIRDFRIASDWPAGAKPVTRTMQYDDLYRVEQVDHTYEGGSDSWVSPFAFEDSGGSDPRRGAPSPRVSFSKRILSQTFRYDWLGNTTSTGDDAGGFYERSLGTITNGAANAGPYQLRNAGGGTAPRDGNLTTQYDDTGNLVGLSVERRAQAPCLPQGASCSQRFAYEWDEVGRLARARRWDGDNLGAASGPLPASAPAVDLRYAYDAADARVLKVASNGGSDSHTVYVFDTLELRQAAWTGGDYERTAWTEVPYLFSQGVRLARLHYADTSVPTLTSGQLHVLLELPDHLGSNTIVLDKATGELVERSTYQPYGGAESDYRPDRWSSFREDYRFTGKEEDIEVGLSYFGKRYLSSALNRWISPDPLVIHEPGSEDLNVYAYVHGAVFKAVDPNGLWSSSTVDWYSKIPIIGPLLFPGTFEPVHQMAIDRVLGNQLSTRDLNTLKDQQVIIDKAQGADVQPQHAMVGEGLPRADAIQKANDFVRSELGEARRFLKAADDWKSMTNDAKMAAGIRDIGMQHLGNAIHTLQDGTSPTHAPFKAWEGESDKAKALIHVLGENKYPGIATKNRYMLEGATRWAYEQALGNKPIGDVFNARGQLVLPGVNAPASGPAVAPPSGAAVQSGAATNASSAGAAAAPPPPPPAAPQSAPLTATQAKCTPW